MQYVKLISFGIIAVIVAIIILYVKSVFNERDELLSQHAIDQVTIQNWEFKVGELKRTVESSNIVVDQLKKETEETQNKLDLANNEVLKYQADNAELVGQIIGSAPIGKSCDENFDWMVDNMIKLGNGFKK